MRTLFLIIILISTTADAAIELGSFAKLDGDFRYQHEYSEVQLASSSHRHRIRARLGVRGKFSDPFIYRFQLVSGTASPVSETQTLDGGFSSKPIQIGLANVAWSVVEGLKVKGGKFKNPFYRIGGSELIWDVDLHPEGLAAHYHVGVGPLRLEFDGGALWAEERPTALDTWILGLVMSAKSPVFPGIQLEIGLGYFDYQNMAGQNPLADPTSGNGNTTVASGASLVYPNDFDLLEWFLALHVGGIMPYEVMVFIDYVTNVALSGGNRTGFLAGFHVGSLSDNGFAFRYFYRRLPPDAVVGAFTDSNFIGGGTNGRGHEFGLKLDMGQKVTLGLTYFRNAQGFNAAMNSHRVLVDLVFKI